MFLHSYFIHNNMNPLFGDDGEKKAAIYNICNMQIHQCPSEKVFKSSQTIWEKRQKESS